MEMQEVAEAIGAFPGDSEEFAVLETPRFSGYWDARCWGAGETEYQGCCVLTWWILETLRCWRC